MMQNQHENPFNITKAVDFSDQEISDYWIDIPETGGFQQLMKPTSAMPMFILGGKGSGKTHLMRYYSYPLQKIRHKGGVALGLTEDGYVGIYLRCGGLNSGRFKEKGQAEEAWESVFAYYMDLWLSQLVVSTALDACAGSEELVSGQEKVCREIIGLFNSWDHGMPASLEMVLELLRNLQKEVDVAVNNCAISGELRVTICATRGVLVFGIPRILVKSVPSLGGCVFTYLIDEFENLSEPQQKYINTLIREKELPCSFKVGARMYGVRTHRTYSADEENKEGSEFETIRLDALLRASNKYDLFAKRLIVRRLSEHGYVTGDTKAQEAMVKSIGGWFATIPQERFAKRETAFIEDKYAGSERPYFESLRKRIEKGSNLGLTKGVSSQGDIDAILKILACPDYPLLEKVNVFLLYQEWSEGKDLREAAADIARDCEVYLHAKVNRRHRHSRALEHFKVDLVAQLLRECHQKQRYVGVETFIAMSVGLPRNLLILLKSVFAWAVYNGETPFIDRHSPISIDSQHAGVAEAADWFFGDARTLGTDGRLVEAGIKNLGALFRTHRFSDKPSECSCTSFSCDISRVSEETRRIIAIAQNWSLLIAVSDRRDWGSDRINEQFQLNPMLAPRWDLAVYRRGVLGLRPEECDAIFDNSQQGEFARMLQSWENRMNAPAFGAKGVGAAQLGLFANLDDND
jgi:hypothetical protein